MDGDDQAVGRSEREADFWGHHLPSIEESLALHDQGPDENTAEMLDALEPLEGRTVLDFACGTGVTSVWLAERGAEVTGLDITPESIERARVLATKAGVDVTFLCGTLEEVAGELPPFDRLFGRYALHHIDLAALVPEFVRLLVPGGTGAFLETMYTNPVLWAARRYLTGRFGVLKVGTPDEKPLGRAELDLLRRSFGELDVRLRQMRCFRMIDSHVLKGRRHGATRVLNRADEALGRRPGLHWLSYERVLVVRKTV